jgi:hypothetical protein
MIALKVRSGVVRYLASPSGATRAAAVAVFAVLLVRGTAPAFAYDAANYWNGSDALISGGHVYEVGRLDLRGALTVLIYVPATLMKYVFGSASGGVTVLVQNSLMIAVLGAVILPRVVALIVPARTSHIWAAAAACVILLSGFAPYPLMDLWALVFVLLGILVVCTAERRWALAAGGVSFGVAFNLRPAYLLPLALGASVWLIFRWGRAVWPTLGVAAALVPQVIVSVAGAGLWRPWPALTTLLASTQSESAAYVVRYDTVAFWDALDPRQAYCNPAYAAVVGTSPMPTSASELALSYLHHFPSSLDFATQKVAASLAWSWETPYAARPPAAGSFLTPIVTLVTVIGFLALVRTLARGLRGRAKMAPAILLGTWVGSLITIVFAQPETRFALPILLLGVIGCLVNLPSARSRPRWSRRNLVWVAAALVVSAALLVVGVGAVAHPAPPGYYDVAICMTS